jgi:hypothetical protein
MPVSGNNKLQRIKTKSYKEDDEEKSGPMQAKRTN